eukprot:7360139-Prymnesium_polylepis.3
MGHRPSCVPVVSTNFRISVSGRFYGFTGLHIERRRQTTSTQLTSCSKQAPTACFGMRGAIQTRIDTID